LATKALTDGGDNNSTSPVSAAGERENNILKVALVLIFP
jgi:hypothetical protein